MKMSRKVVILLALCLVFATILSSCHGGKKMDEFEVPVTFDENRQYEIVFWAKNDNNKIQQQIYYKAIEDFEKIYPNIKVSLKPFVNYNDIYREVLTNIKTGTTPNVCITYPDHIATYLSGENLVVPLDDLMADEKYGLGGSAVKFDAPTKDEIVDKFLEEGQLGGEQYAIPFMRSTEACYINVDLVHALGFDVPDVLTWDFIFEVSRAATQPVGQDEEGNPIYINGQTAIIPFIYKSTDNMMIQMLKQKGYDYSDDDGNILMFNEDTKDLLYMIADRVEEGVFTTFDIANAYPGDLINAGKCIFGVDSTAGATWIGTGAPNYEISADSIVEFELAVRPVPQFDKENPVMISQGPSICIFNKEDAGEVMASWLFVQYLLTNEVQIAYSQTEGYAPVTTKAQQSAEYLDYLSRAGQLDENGNGDLYYAPKIEATRLLLDNIDNTFITPVFNGSASLRNGAGMLIEETGKAIRRNVNVDNQWMEKTFGKVKSLYKLGESVNVGSDATENNGDVNRQDNTSSLGELPIESIVLLSSLGVIWVLIGTYVGVGYLIKRRRAKRE